MNLPFGLDFVSVLVGVAFALFVWPLVMSFIGGLTSRTAPAKKS